MADFELMEDLCTYVGFGDADAQTLRDLAPALRLVFPEIVDEFYEAIGRAPAAAGVFDGPDQIRAQKAHLGRWLEGLVGGVYDEAYFEQRARIGRVHVRIELDQRYMFAGMNIVRRGLHRGLAQADGTGADLRIAGHAAIDRLCDIELAIMLETYREDYIDRIERSARLAMMGQLTATIGHELRNPLAVMETSLHLLRKRVDSDERASKHVDRIALQVKTCSTIISDLLSLVRDRELQPEPCDPKEFVTAALGQLRVPDSISVEVDLAEDLDGARVDAGQMRQAVANLVQNAIQAIGADDGTVVVSVRRDGDTLCLAVEDDGPGIPPAVLPRIFEPLFTTRAQGIGLGLALCRRVVEAHGGTITAGQRTGHDRGARVEIVVSHAYAS